MFPCSPYCSLVPLFPCSPYCSLICCPFELCTMYYVLCTMYYVLCTMYYVLCTMYYVTMYIHFCTISCTVVEGWGILYYHIPNIYIPNIYIPNIFDSNIRICHIILYTLPYPTLRLISCSDNYLIIIPMHMT
jgi:hypothetical protein